MRRQMPRGQLTLGFLIHFLIADFLGLGGTGGINHHSKIWGAKSPIFFNGVWGPRCRPDPEKQLSPAGQSCIKNPSAVSNRFGAVSDEVGRRSCFAEAAQHRQLPPERELPGPGPEASRPGPPVWEHLGLQSLNGGWGLLKIIANPLTSEL